jgi:hypothetical protein
MGQDPSISFSHQFISDSSVILTAIEIDRKELGDRREDNRKGDPLLH